MLSTLITKFRRLTTAASFSTSKGWTPRPWLMLSFQLGGASSHGASGVSETASTIPTGSPAATDEDAEAFASFDAVLENIAGLSAADVSEAIHRLIGDVRIDREQLSAILQQHSFRPGQVASTLSDLYGDDCELTPEARQLRGALLRFMTSVLAGILGSDPPDEMPVSLHIPGVSAPREKAP